MSIRIIQNKLRAWSAHNFPGRPAWQPLLGAGEELGELFHSYLKRQQGIRGTEEEHRAKEQDAIGDALIFLADFCNEEGYRLDECMELAWEEIKDRDFQKFPLNGRTE